MQGLIWLNSLRRRARERPEFGRARSSVIAFDLPPGVKGPVLLPVSNPARAATLAEVTVRIAVADVMGKLAAQAALGQGIKRVVFDRGGAPFHGKVKALADAARETGRPF